MSNGSYQFSITVQDARRNLWTWKQNKTDIIHILIQFELQSSGRASYLQTFYLFLSAVIRVYWCGCAMMSICSINSAQLLAIASFHYSITLVAPVHIVRFVHLQLRLLLWDVCETSSGFHSKFLVGGVGKKVEPGEPGGNRVEQLELWGTNTTWWFSSGRLSDRLGQEMVWFVYPELLCLIIVLTEQTCVSHLRSFV